MEKLLVIEDSEEIRSRLALGLGADYVVVNAADCADAIDQFERHSPKVVVLDLGLPPEEDGTLQAFRCLERILTAEPATKVVVLAEPGGRELAYRALRHGAYDFYDEPVDVAVLRVVVQRAFHLAAIESERALLQQALLRKSSGIEGLVGQCPAMQRALSMVHRVAPSDVPVLIVGERGTGRRTIARALASLSMRAEGPFVPICCTDVPEELLESELFGVEQGFSGACSRSTGRIDYAQHGTLFLEELGAVPPQLQGRLARLVEERTFVRVGGAHKVRVDARMLCAAHPDFLQRAGDAASDFYRSLSAVTLQLPPLRERGEDIVLLAQLFLQKAAQSFHKKVRGFTPAALLALRRYDWPGNVRELESRVQRGVLMTESPFLEVQALGFVEEAPETPPLKLLTLKEARDMVERGAILAAVGNSGGNMVKASEILGVCRPTLYDLMKKHGLHKAPRGGADQTETAMVPSRGMS